MEPINNGEFRDEKGRFTEGNNYSQGRPKGSVSPITKVKQIFEENPEKFEAFVNAYMTDEKNLKHVVEMLDGKPHQATDVTTGGDKITFMPSEIMEKNDIRTEDTDQ